MRRVFPLVAGLAFWAAGCAGPDPTPAAMPGESAVQSQPQETVDSVPVESSAELAPPSVEVSTVETPAADEDDPLVYVVDGTHFYHTESCRFLDDPERPVLKDRRSLAQKEGFEACTVCKPNA